MYSNLDLLKVFLEESLSILGVVIVYVWIRPFLLKHNHIVLGLYHRESALRASITVFIITYLGVAPVISLIENSKGLVYDFIFLRTGDLGSARVSTQLVILALFLLSYYITRDVYFSSAFSLFMAFFHEMVFQILFELTPNAHLQGEFYSIVQLLSYLQASIALGFLSKKLGSSYYQQVSKWISLWLVYMLIWFTFFNYNITVFNFSYKVFTQTVYYSSLSVGFLEWFSWYGIFAIFVYALIKVKYKTKSVSKIDTLENEIQTIDSN